MVRLLCDLQMPLSQQAELSGISYKHLHRLVRREWQGWKLGTAEKWCEVCGFDLWQLQAKAPDMKKIPWGSEHPNVVEALKAYFRLRLPNVAPTKKNIFDLAQILQNWK